MSRSRPRDPARLAAPLLVGILAGAVALGGCASAGAPTGSAASPTATPAPSAAGHAAPSGDVQRVAISVANGKVVGGVSRVQVPLGGTVEVLVTSDAADEAHLHGYDRTVEIPAGGSATLTFVADVPGVFELELHHSGAQLAQLQVG